MNQGSMPRIRAGRQRVRPTARALAPDRARAALFGLKPISSAIAMMRCRVASDTPGCPFSAYDTAPLDTPARRAMSAIVVRFTRSPVVRVELTGGEIGFTPKGTGPLREIGRALSRYRASSEAFGGQSA